MKQLLLLILFAFGIGSVLNAQTIPQGMKYQGVARDLTGNVLSGKEISLKINLKSNFSEPITHYIETHNITTNEFGLFSVTVGEGSILSGEFSKVPWSTENIWMEIGVKEKGQTDYTIISDSKLLAVPYAFHAATAAELTNAQSEGSGPGVPAQVWTLFGNSNTNPLVDKLGTTDLADLVFVTNNIERLRIESNGDIKIVNSLEIGKNLTVKENVYLNTVTGQTINNGPLTVANASATLLTGTLTVNGATDLDNTLNVDGATSLNSTLDVDGATDLNNTLNVDGVTDLNSALNVNNMSPTLLTGKLRVNKTALFKDSVFLDDALHQSTSSSNGALVVAGGAGVGGNLNVGGSSTFGGPVSFGAAVTISDATESTSTTTGALKVAGGVGIVKRVNVGGAVLLGNTLGVTGATTLSNTLGVTGATTLSNTLGVTGATTLSSTLGVTGIASLNNTTESTTTGNGSLVVAGGAGIAKNVNIGGTLTTTGATTLNNVLNVNGSTSYLANFTNSSSGNGINIQIAAATPANANDFVTFRNSGGTVVGRIEGETQAEMVSSDDYQDELLSVDLAVASASIDLAIAIAEEIQAGLDVAAAASSSTGCVGLGACVTAPIPSLIVAAGTNLALKTANLASVSINEADAIIAKADFEASKAANRGVSYASGAADYAEWLPKLNKSEVFRAGDIVAVREGHITLNTSGATQFMVVSHKPMVLGNVPGDGNTANFEKVAFMGQVPVRVIGKVNRGDYILPDGTNRGYGKAIAPGKMKPEEFGRIVGIAWSSSENGTYNMINVAVGLNANDLAGVVATQNQTISKQAEEINALKQEMNSISATLAKLVPGFSEQTGSRTEPVSQVRTPAAQARHGDALLPNTMHADNIVYFEVTRPQIEAMWFMAEKVFAESGADLNTHPFWKRFKSDAGFKAEIMNQFEGKIKNAFHTHKEANKIFSK
jgi:hypothetical protein